MARGGKKKICTGCGDELPLEMFNVDKRRPRGKCRRCHNIWNRYRITYYQFVEMLEKQDHKCLICEGNINDKAAVVDHCHSGGHVRGLLCGSCNRGLGNFRDNPEFLVNAALFLRNDIA